MVLMIILVLLVAAWTLSYWWLNKKVAGKVEVHHDDNYANGEQNQALAIGRVQQAARCLA
jgi:hypothetical protein